MMSKLSDLVREYKESPSVKLEKEIIDYIVNVDNPEELDKLHRKVEDEWYKVSNYRLRHLHGGLYAVTESFSMDNGMMCYAYKIDLDESVLSASVHIRATVRSIGTACRTKDTFLRWR